MQKEFQLQIDRNRDRFSQRASTAIDAVRKIAAPRIRHGAIHLVTETSQKPYTNYEVVKRIDLKEINSEKDQVPVHVNVNFVDDTEDVVGESDDDDDTRLNLRFYLTEDSKKHSDRRFDISFVYKNTSENKIYQMDTLQLTAFKSAWKSRYEFLRKNLKIEKGIEHVTVSISTRDDLDGGVKLTDEQKTYMTNSIRSIILKKLNHKS